MRTNLPGIIIFNMAPAVGWDRSQLFFIQPAIIPLIIPLIDAGCRFCWDLSQPTVFGRFLGVHLAEDTIATFIERVGRRAVGLHLVVIIGAKVPAIRGIPLFPLLNAILCMQREKLGGEVGKIKPLLHQLGMTPTHPLHIFRADRPIPIRRLRKLFDHS
ncbi:MAG: hypothetical protein NXI22_21855 [bacterium]|nr:hypothetical protein [bacterium]